MTQPGGRLTGLADRILHVGVICGRDMLTSAQRGDLERQLQLIGKKHRGHLLVLHHGCGRDADEVAHRAAQALGGWHIHGHPARDVQSGEVLLRNGVIRGLHRILESKHPGQRDADIVDISQVLIAVLGPHQRPDLDAAIRRAQAADRNVICLGMNSVADKLPARKPEPAPGHPAAMPAGRTPGWAGRQGREDCRMGSPCPKYKTFLATYKLPECDASLRLWHEYRAQTKPARVSMASPTSRRKSRRRGTRAPSDASASGRKTAHRYTRDQQRTSDVSPEIAALLLKVNQQNTLVDAWR
jgi:hypothetical protein